MAVSNGRPASIQGLDRPSMNERPRIQSVDPDLFRSVMGRFATGVTVVTAEASDEVRGMTANAFLSASLEPPLCVVSVGLKAHMHTHLVEAQRFAVNILAADQEALATHFAGRPDPGLSVSFETVNGVPTLAKSHARLVADLQDTHVSGDHTLFIGHVRYMGIGDGEPLLYYRGRFGSLNEQKADQA